MEAIYTGDIFLVLFRGFVKRDTLNRGRLANQF